MVSIILSLLLLFCLMAHWRLPQRLIGQYNCRWSHIHQNFFWRQDGLDISSDLHYYRFYGKMGKFIAYSIIISRNKLFGLLGTIVAIYVPQVLEKCFYQKVFSFVRRLKRRKEIDCKLEPIKRQEGGFCDWFEEGTSPHSYKKLLILKREMIQVWFSKLISNKSLKNKIIYCFVWVFTYCFKQ